jgi:flagellar assembly protein FliH
MNASRLFEDFGEAPKRPKAKTPLGVEEVEDQKLEAFENGYQAGWEDAIKAQASTGAHVSTDLAARLQDASFEYHEVRNTLNGAVNDIMTELVKTLLPKIAQESLGAHVREQVAAMARSGLERTIEIVVAPESEDAVRSVLDAEVGPPFELVADEHLAPAQVILRLGPDEREINLVRIVDEIGTMVTAFFETEKSEVTNG